jgi:hypothetical protein
MKVALCFAGLPRLIDKCKNNIKTYFGEDCHIYAHFWWDDSYKGKVNRWHVVERFDIVENPIKTFIEAYNPKKIIFEESPVYDTRKTPIHGLECRRGQPFEKTYSSLDYLYTGENCNWCKEESEYNTVMNTSCIYMLYSRHSSINRCIQLIDNLEEYDIIIVARTDLTFIDSNKHTTFLQDIANCDIKSNTVFMPSTLYGGPKFGGEHPDRLGDWFFIGNPSTVKSYFDSAFQSIISKKNKIPVHNQERLIHFSLISNVLIDKFISSMTLRRFIIEEWEDISYYKKNKKTPEFIEKLFDIKTEQFIEDDFAPFYVKYINKA